MKSQSASGQVLVLILLVVLVGMTVGLSVASRTLTTLRNSAELTQSNRAFSAAEAGIEQALLKLKADESCGTNGELCQPTIEGVESKVTIINAGGSTKAYGISSLPRDEVFQLSLTGYAANVVDLYWGMRNDNTSCSQAAAIVVSLVYRNAGGEYGLSKLPIDPACTADGSNPSRATNGFDSVANSNPIDELILQDDARKSDYGFKRTITLKGAGGMADASVTLVSMRVKLMYAGQKPVAFAPYAGVNLPEQGQQITSTAAVGGQQRTIKVLRSNETVPAIFDYALFNGSTSTLSK